MENRVNGSKIYGSSKVVDKKDIPLDWECEGDADTLYISFGKPKPALGVDVGEGALFMRRITCRLMACLTAAASTQRFQSQTLP